MTTTRIKAEQFPDLADEALYPRLSEQKMAMLAKKGERRSFAPGEVLYEQGLRDAPFFIIESGRVDLIDRKPGKEVWIAEADAGTFVGDIATFTGEPAMAECVASEPTDTIAFDRPGLRALLAGSPEMGELVLGCLLARRAFHEGAGHGVLRLIAERGSRRAFEVRDLLERNLVPLRFHDVDLDPYADKILDWLDITREETPVLVRNDRVLRNPSAAQLARELGLRADVDGQRFDLVVLGAGPAGLAAAVSGGSEGLRTFVAEAWGPGGQAGTSSRIENYLGFPSGISGAELTRAATLQARRFDAVLSSFHRAVELTDGPEGLTRVDLDDGQHVVGRTVVMATGARWRELAVPDVDRYRGAGLYHAAMPADAERYRDEDVLVVGGGNSAGQAATHLARYARSVRVAVRGEALSSTMSRYLVERIERAPPRRGAHRHGGGRAARPRAARRRHPPQRGRRGAGAGPGGVRDDRRRAVHRGGHGGAERRRRGLPAVRAGGGRVRRQAQLAAGRPRSPHAGDGAARRVRRRRRARGGDQPGRRRRGRRVPGDPLRPRPAGRLTAGAAAARRRRGGDARDAEVAVVADHELALPSSAATPEGPARAAGR